MNQEYLVLSFLIPDQEMEREFVYDGFPSIQTQNFNWSLVKAIESGNELKFSYISTRAISDYPINPSKVIHKKKWVEKISNSQEIEIFEIPFLNRGILKILTRFISSFYYSFQFFIGNKNKKGIIVYSVHVPFMLTGFLVSKIFKIDLISVWTDPPSVPYEHDNFLKRSLRKIEYKISTFLMKQSTKLIVLTKHLAEDFSKGTPYIVIEGILDEKKIRELVAQSDYKDNSSEEKIKIIYTGSVEEKYGIGKIVEAIQMLNSEKVQLDIYGKGNFVKKIQKNKYKNVFYKGFLPYKEILKIQNNADFLINARSNNDEYVKYSFPSKTMEYLASGTPVISTMLPGIPDNYKNHLIEIKNSSPIEIKKTVECALKLDIKKRNEIAKNAKEFIYKKNISTQGEKILKFINSK